MNSRNYAFPGSVHWSRARIYDFIEWTSDWKAARNALLRKDVPLAPWLYNCRQAHFPGMRGSMSWPAADRPRCDIRFGRSTLARHRRTPPPFRSNAPNATAPTGDDPTTEAVALPKVIPDSWA